MLERIPLFIEQSKEARQLARRYSINANKARQIAYHYAQDANHLLVDIALYTQLKDEPSKQLLALTEKSNYLKHRFDIVNSVRLELDKKITDLRLQAITYNQSKKWFRSKFIQVKLFILLQKYQKTTPEYQRLKQDVSENNKQLVNQQNILQQINASESRDNKLISHYCELNQYWAFLSLHYRNSMDAFNEKATTLEGKVFELKGCGDVDSEERLDQSQYIAKHYYLEDHVHNAVIKTLLKWDKYNKQFLGLSQNINAGAFWIRNQGHIDTIIHRLANNDHRLMRPFIRDAFQIYTNSDIHLANLNIVDHIAESDFQRDFDRFICGINIHKRINHCPSIRPFCHLGHRDAIQIIPVNDKKNPLQGRYQGARITAKICIENNVISSTAALQGIFASDGAFGNLHIINNKIKTGGTHTITIAGMLGGSIKGNTNLEGEPLDNIKILPLRLGGGANCYILGFHQDSSYKYNNIVGLPKEQDYRQQISIHNQNKVGVTFYTHFHMDRFVEIYTNISQSKDEMNIICKLQKAKKQPMVVVQTHYVIEKLLVEGNAVLIT